MLLRRPPACEPDRAPRKQERKYVRKIVNRIGDQRQRIGDVAENQLRTDEQCVQHQSRRERRPEAEGYVTVWGVSVRARRIMMVMMGHASATTAKMVVWFDRYCSSERNPNTTTPYSTTR